jgi:hypothetical protein
MQYASFWNLHNNLLMGTEEARLMSRGYKKGGLDGGMYLLSPVTNGPIATSVRLACAICYFSGGSPLDIMLKYGMAHLEVMEGVWYVVEAVIKLGEFKIGYPESADKQDEIAWGFQAASKANIDICAGAIDGILIWISKPSKKNAEKAEVSQQKFLCSCKEKLSLNCQAVSDCNERILDISIACGGSSSDCLAFKCHRPWPYGGKHSLLKAAIC